MGVSVSSFPRRIEGEVWAAIGVTTLLLRVAVSRTSRRLALGGLREGIRYLAFCCCYLFTFFPFLFFVVFSCYIDAIMIISYIEILIVISVYSPDATSNGTKTGT